ncbi:hypothetical protein [Streptomyces pinistramenti]|uniref:hypothetical protein n=1 Tax=Streptomyces pinistramenti TaxID=2884812 RepID=UPI001D069A2F|nr:hypothetical protein [Streptomyces pinistramenti]MCB5907803.1 hypothetical protein [Streptomyces pinistramenti]
MLLGASAAALLAAGCSGQGSRENGKGTGQPSESGSSGPMANPTAPSGVLGANFNEDPSDMRFSQLRGLSASWLRGFLPMPEADEGLPARQRAVATLLGAGKQGYGTVLSLKFPYQGQALPAPGSALMDAELERVDKVARAVMGTVDILVIGNEPFLESRPADRDGPAVNAFYEHVARHLVAYRKERFGARCKTRLYMGALNHLDDPGQRTAATRRWVEFVHDTKEIEGVDIHPHVVSIDAGQKYLDYVVPHLRDDQKFLVTEFSLVLNWREHLRDTIPVPFAMRYGMDPHTRVWELLKEAVRNPFPQEKWNAFLAMSPWFSANAHFLRDQVQRFRDTGKLAVATYGVVQADAMVRNIGPDKQPWLLNSLYANRTVQEHGDGTTGRNQAWCKDFRALQRQRDHLPVRTGETAT